MGGVCTHLVRPIGQEFLAEISLDDCPLKQFLDQPDRPVQEVFGHGAWIVGIALGHVWEQAQNAVAFDMGPRHEWWVIDQGCTHRDRRKTSRCHDIDSARFLVSEGGTDPPTGDKSATRIESGNGSLTGAVQPSRTIAPHALAHSAGRWYVRAWSRDHNDFRDYNLNRISAVTSSRLSSVDPSLDFEWVHKMNLVIRPNPALPRERQASVAAEHGMTDGSLVFPCRLSLSFYLMSEHNFDVEPGVLKPGKQQIVLENREEIIQARAVARRMSIEALTRAQASDTRP